MAPPLLERSCLSLLNAARRTLDNIAEGAEGAAEAAAMADRIVDYIGHGVTDQHPTGRLTHPVPTDLALASLSEAERSIYWAGYGAGRDDEAEAVDMPAAANSVIDQHPTGAWTPRSAAEVVEIIYRTHGCSCDEHPSNGTSAACAAWRRRAAEQVAAALRPAVEGGVALRPCPGCSDAWIPSDNLLCSDCALAVVQRAQERTP